MDIHKLMVTALSISFFMTPQTTAQTDFYSENVNNANILTINITKIDVSDTTLELTWEIRNNSMEDAWILTGLASSGTTISAFVGEDGKTLLMRRRLDLPWKGTTPFPALNGRYFRLRARQVLAETVSLAIPVWPDHDQTPVGSTYLKDSKQLKRLVIEIGYYAGDLPSAVHRALEQDEKNPRIVPSVDPSYTRSITEWFGGLRGFNNLNELLNWRDDEVLIPYTSQAFSGERFLCTTVDNLNIPCEKEKGGGLPLDFDFSNYTRVEIQYHPSMLEYFFPFDGQQSLLSPSEKEYLYSTKTVVFKNHDNLKILSDELNNGDLYGANVCQRSIAYLGCYNGDEHILSIPIYNNNSIVTKGRHLFRYPNDLKSLRMLTPHVQQIDLRVKCVANMKHLWYQFRLYEKVKKPGFFRRRKTSYPAPNKWCESILRAFRTSGKNNEYPVKPYKCPSAGYGECHYAMNPNCKLKSPPDMVLLFETKGSWKQYGGPELFTFDNHEPRGGCVLFNDGTVQFIRTTEELQQLRWK